MTYQIKLIIINSVKNIYYAKYGDHATNRVNSVWHGVNGIRKDNTKYSYDKAGNIATVTENGIEIAKYVYDGLNRLIRENNSTFGKITYEYDNAGNILCKAIDGKRYKYTYSQNGWKDQLLERSYKEYDGKTVHEYFKYDVIGNPVIYRNRTLSWQGRRLLRYGNNEYYAEYTYDVNGVRTSKHAITPVGTVDSKYIYDGNNLVAEQRNGSWIYYLYGVDGISGFRYNGITYLYRKNVQGDVTHIYKQEEDTTLTLVAHCSYDAWGNCDILQDKDGIATFNPFRYRSYYFDEETGLYYLQTRYYDPELGRFISADSIEYLDPETLGGLNLYAYCGNNPVMRTDSLGTDWNSFWKGVGDWFVNAGNWINNNIIQPVGNFIVDNLDLIIAGVLIVGAIIVTVATFGAGSLIAMAAGAIIGAAYGALNSYLTGGVWWQGAITGLVVGAFGGVHGLSGGLAAAGMSIIWDRVNGKTFGADTLERAAVSGIVAGLFSAGANHFTSISVGTGGFVDFIVNLVYASIFTMGNIAYDLTVKSLGKNYGK